MANTELTLTIKADCYPEETPAIEQILFEGKDVTEIVLRECRTGDAPGVCCLDGPCREALEALVNELLMQRHYSSCLEGCADCCAP